MKYRLIIIALSSFLLFACNGPSISGNWKLQKAEYVDVRSGNVQLSFDLEDPKKFREDMYRRMLPEEFINDSQIKKDLGTDTSIASAFIRAEVDKYFNKAQLARILLNTGGKMELHNQGMIVPSSVPGWNFSDTIGGSWKRLDDTLFLSTGDVSKRQSPIITESVDGYNWKFIITSLSTKELKLQQVFINAKEKGNRYVFTRE